ITPFESQSKPMALRSPFANTRHSDVLAGGLAAASTLQTMIVVRRVSSSSQRLHEEPIETYIFPSRPKPIVRVQCGVVETGRSTTFTGIPSTLPLAYFTFRTVGLVAMYRKPL